MPQLNTKPSVRTVTFFIIVLPPCVYLATAYAELARAPVPWLWATLTRVHVRTLLRSEIQQSNSYLPVIYATLPRGSQTCCLAEKGETSTLVHRVASISSHEPVTISKVQNSHTALLSSLDAIEVRFRHIDMIAKNHRALARQACFGAVYNVKHKAAGVLQCVRGAVLRSYSTFF